MILLFEKIFQYLFFFIQNIKSKRNFLPPFQDILKIRLKSSKNKLNFKLKSNIDLFVIRFYSSVKEIGDYIKSTYNQHYSDSGSGFQIQDIFKELNIGREFAQANAIKYVCRYGKKHGKNKMDLFKAIHYITLLLNYDRSEDESK